MMARFDDTRIEVDIPDIFICRSVTNEKTSEVMAVQFSSTLAGPLDAYS